MDKETKEFYEEQKVAEEGRTASEAMNIVKARFPDAKVMFAEGF